MIRRATPIRDYLAEQLPESYGNEPLRVRCRRCVRRAADRSPRLSDAYVFYGLQGGTTRMGPWMHGVTGWRGLQADVRLSNGQWLSFAALLPDARPLGALVAVRVRNGAHASCIVVLTSIWAVRRVTAPLGIVAHAAERLGRDVNAPHPSWKPAAGEMRQAAHAFNEMQGPPAAVVREPDTHAGRVVA